MSPKDPASAVSDAPNVKVPPTAAHVAHDYPEVWKAFQQLGEQASKAGPLDVRTRRLVHLALAIAAGSEGATHSHTRRGLAEGITPEEMEHVALLSITAIGWGSAIKGLTWVRDITRKHRPVGEDEAQ